jgi:hypothetical protein
MTDSSDESSYSEELFEEIFRKGGKAIEHIFEEDKRTQFVNLLENW